jgi:hypothetical protein
VHTRHFFRYLPHMLLEGLSDRKIDEMVTDLLPDLFAVSQTPLPAWVPD